VALDAVVCHQKTIRIFNPVASVLRSTSASSLHAAQMPPAILADLLGLSESSAAHWCALAGGEGHSYAAHAARRYTTNA
jgi:hypothetical protein